MTTNPVENGINFTKNQVRRQSRLSRRTECLQLKVYSMGSECVLEKKNQENILTEQREQHRILTNLEAAVSEMALCLTNVLRSYSSTRVIDLMTHSVERVLWEGRLVGFKDIK